MVTKKTILYFAAWSLLLGTKAGAQELTQYVNPFVGTGGHGHTFPGATVPFGMVQLSPDTRIEGWDGCSGYHYSDTLLYGFSHTHLSGTGIPDYGDVLIMPTVGEINWENGHKDGIDEGYGSRFRHSDEKAAPGYYSVLLSDYGIAAELTATMRVGMHRYTFPSTSEAQIILDLLHRDALLDVDIEILNDSTIRGRRISKAWAEEQYIYFYGVFSKPFVRHQMCFAQIGHPDADSVRAKSAFTFHTRQGESILLKVGISAVSCDGAAKNLQSELPHWDFERVRQQANDRWNEELSKIVVRDPNIDKMTVFYTSLYHTMIHPNIYMDVDGRYRGTDLKVHHTDAHTQYTVFSLWDTYRAAHPLYTLIQRNRTRDFICTFLQQYLDGGKLPMWELAGNYTGCMIGYHSTSVIADAYAKGIRDFDLPLAFRAMKHSAMQDPLGLEYYRKHGVITAGDESESVSKTLEYAYDDWCIAQMAKAIGKEEAFDYFIQRAQNYKNLFDPSTSFMRARANHQWWDPFDPTEVNFHYTEANSWQYSFAAQHDIKGLIRLYGGKHAFEQKLDDLFANSRPLIGRVQPDITGLIGQYAHGNEPSHHIAYLYHYTDHPHKTQAIIHRIMQEMYHNSPKGLPGNEDCGQMSAWYVFSALGFYPVTPGLPYYTPGTPAFSSAEIHLENGRVMQIHAPHQSDSTYFVRDILLNGHRLKGGVLHHEDLLAGGTLEFVMTDTPGMRRQSPPWTPGIDTPRITPLPFISAEGRTFRDSIVLRLSDVEKDCAIYYSTEEGDTASQWKPYQGPIPLHSSTKIRAVAEKNGIKSRYINAQFHKVNTSLTLSLNTPYSNQYAAGGKGALIDQLRGDNNYRTGVWQGFEGRDVEAIVDLGSRKWIGRIDMGFLQDIKSWIWYPKTLLIEVGDTPESLREIAHLNNAFAPDQYGAYTCQMGADIRVKARYVRLTAINRGPCPKWHPGAGGKSWIFADEITIEQR